MHVITTEHFGLKAADSLMSTYAHGHPSPHHTVHLNLRSGAAWAPLPASAADMVTSKRRPDGGGDDSVDEELQQAASVPHCMS